MYHAVNISYPNPTLISPQTEFMITKPLGKFTVWCCSFRCRKYAVGWLVVGVGYVAVSILVFDLGQWQSIVTMYGKGYFL